MKKSKIISTLFVLLAIFTGIINSSCSNGSSSVDSDVISNSRILLSGSVWHVGMDTSSYTISDVAGKNIFMVKLNPSVSNTISKADTRIVSSSSLDADRVASSSLATSISFDSFLSNTENSAIASYSTPVIDPSTFGGIIENNSRSVVSSPVRSTIGNHSYSVDNSKNIYVDTVNDGVYEKKAATLKAIGKHCYVWVVNENFTSEEPSGLRVNLAFAQECANNFDKIYPLILNVFGSESDNILKFNGGNGINLAEMSSYDTGTMVNIVIYDIPSSGVLGYFYSKDYYDPNGTVFLDSSPYKVLNYSNKGKYFYIDAAYANSNKGLVFSTLAHEFQHMIDFNQKNILQNKAPTTGYNEMLSMLCEDMLSSELETLCSSSYDAISDSPFFRLKSFNESYYLSGIGDWISDSNVLSSYATNYVFGAWLARQYGGAEFVKKISTNPYVDITSIEVATGEDFDNIVESYIQSLVLKSSTISTLKKNASKNLLYGSYDYPMQSIDLWNSNWSFSVSYNNKNYTCNGPIVFSSDSQLDLRPYGFSIHYIGTASSSQNEVTVNFSSSTVDQRVYILAEAQEGTFYYWKVE